MGNASTRPAAAAPAAQLCGSGARGGGGAASAAASTPSSGPVGLTSLATPPPPPPPLVSEPVPIPASAAASADAAAGRPTKASLYGLRARPSRRASGGSSSDSSDDDYGLGPAPGAARRAAPAPLAPPSPPLALPAPGTPTGGSGGGVPRRSSARLGRDAAGSISGSLGVGGGSPLARGGSSLRSRHSLRLLGGAGGLPPPGHAQQQQQQQQQQPYGLSTMQRHEAGAEPEGESDGEWDAEDAEDFLAELGGGGGGAGGVAGGGEPPPLAQPSTAPPHGAVAHHGTSQSEAARLLLVAASSSSIQPQPLPLLQLAGSPSAAQFSGLSGSGTTDGGGSAGGGSGGGAGPTGTLAASPASPYPDPRQHQQLGGSSPACSGSGAARHPVLPSDGVGGAHPPTPAATHPHPSSSSGSGGGGGGVGALLLLASRGSEDSSTGSSHGGGGVAPPLPGAASTTPPSAAAPTRMVAATAAAAAAAAAAATAADAERRDRMIRDQTTVVVPDWMIMLQRVFDAAGLPRSQLDTFVARLQTAVFAPGQPIVRQGEVGDRFYIIEAGEVTVEEQRSADDEPRVLTRLYPGAHFGEFSLVREQPRVASVVARGARGAVCRFLAKASFQALVEAQPSYSIVIRELVAETDATRQKREAAQRSGATSQATKVQFVRANASVAKITKTARRGVNEQRQETVNTYTLLRQLGAGSYGRVHLARDGGGDGRIYAIKVVDKHKLRRRRLGASDAELLREVEVMKKLRHPNLVALHEVIDDGATNALFMVQEFCECGPVMTEAEYNTPLAPPVARAYFRDILQGLEYLHFQRVIHRDLKPSNVLVSNDGHAKIGDFGVSVVLRAPGGGGGGGGGDLAADTLTEVAGTPAFMAPELFDDAPRYSGRAADVWALGATLYCLTVGRPPYMANSERELVAKLRSAGVDAVEPAYPRELLPALRNLLRRMLCKDPAARIRLRDVREHPWVTDEGTEPLPRTNYVRIDLDDGEDSDDDAAVAGVDSDDDGAGAGGAKRAAERLPLDNAGGELLPSAAAARLGGRGGGAAGAAGALRAATVSTPTLGGGGSAGRLGVHTRHASASLGTPRTGGADGAAAPGGGFPHASKAGAAGSGGDLHATLGGCDATLLPGGGTGGGGPASALSSQTFSVLSSGGGVERSLAPPWGPPAAAPLSGDAAGAGSSSSGSGGGGGGPLELHPPAAAGSSSSSDSRSASLELLMRDERAALAAAATPAAAGGVGGSEPPPVGSSGSGTGGSVPSSTGGGGGGGSGSHLDLLLLATHSKVEITGRSVAASASKSWARGGGSSGGGGAADRLMPGAVQPPAGTAGSGGGGGGVRRGSSVSVVYSANLAEVAAAAAAAGVMGGGGGQPWGPPSSSSSSLTLQAPSAASTPRVSHSRASQGSALSAASHGQQPQPPQQPQQPQPQLFVRGLHRKSSIVGQLESIMAAQAAAASAPQQQPPQQQQCRRGSAARLVSSVSAAAGGLSPAARLDGTVVGGSPPPAGYYGAATPATTPNNHHLVTKKLSRTSVLSNQDAQEAAAAAEATGGSGSGCGAGALQLLHSKHSSASMGQGGDADSPPPVGSAPPHTLLRRWSSDGQQQPVLQPTRRSPGPVGGGGSDSFGGPPAPSADSSSQRNASKSSASPSTPSRHSSGGAGGSVADGGLAAHQQAAAGRALGRKSSHTLHSSHALHSSGGAVASPSSRGGGGGGGGPAQALAPGWLPSAVRVLRRRSSVGESAARAAAAAAAATAAGAAGGYGALGGGASSSGNPLLMSPTAGTVVSGGGFSDHGASASMLLGQGDAEAAKKAHLQKLRARQLALLRGHSALTAEDRDVLMEQNRIAIHQARAEALVEEIELFSPEQLARPLLAEPLATASSSARSAGGASGGGGASTASSGGERGAHSQSQSSAASLPTRSQQQQQPPQLMGPASRFMASPLSFSTQQRTGAPPGSLAAAGHHADASRVSSPHAPPPQRDESFRLDALLLMSPEFSALRRPSVAGGSGGTFGGATPSQMLHTLRNHHSVATGLGHEAAAVSPARPIQRRGSTSGLELRSPGPRMAAQPATAGLERYSQQRAHQSPPPPVLQPPFALLAAPRTPGVPPLGIDGLCVAPCAQQRQLPSTENGTPLRATCRSSARASPADTDDAQALHYALGEALYGYPASAYKGVASFSRAAPAGPGASSPGQLAAPGGLMSPGFMSPAGRAGFMSPGRRGAGLSRAFSWAPEPTSAARPPLASAAFRAASARALLPAASSSLATSGPLAPSPPAPAQHLSRHPLARGWSHSFSHSGDDGGGAAHAFESSQLPRQLGGGGSGAATTTVMMLQQQHHGHPQLGRRDGAVAVGSLAMGHTPATAAIGSPSLTRLHAAAGLSRRLAETRDNSEVAAAEANDSVGVAAGIARAASPALAAAAAAAGVSGDLVPPLTPALPPFAAPALQWRAPALHELPAALVVPVVLSHVTPTIRAKLVLAARAPVDAAVVLCTTSLLRAAGLSDEALAAALPPPAVMWEHVLVACGLEDQPRGDAEGVADSRLGRAAAAPAAGLEGVHGSVSAGTAPATDAATVPLARAAARVLPAPRMLLPVPCEPGGTPLFTFGWEQHGGSEPPQEDRRRRASCDDDSAPVVTLNDASLSSIFGDGDGAPRQRGPLDSSSTQSSSMGGGDATPVDAAASTAAPTAVDDDPPLDLDAALRGRKLTRREDFVMVTEKVGQRADGGVVKKAVIFRAHRDTGGSLSVANPQRGLPNGGNSGSAAASAGLGNAAAPLPRSGSKGGNLSSATPGSSRRAGSRLGATPVATPSPSPSPASQAAPHRINSLSSFSLVPHAGLPASSHANGALLSPTGIVSPTDSSSTPLADDAPPGPRTGFMLSAGGANMTRSSSLGSLDGLVAHELPGQQPDGTPMGSPACVVSDDEDIPLFGVSDDGGNTRRGRSALPVGGDSVAASCDGSGAAAVPEPPFSAAVVEAATESRDILRRSILGMKRLGSGGRNALKYRASLAAVDEEALLASGGSGVDGDSSLRRRALTSVEDVDDAAEMSDSESGDAPADGQGEERLRRSRSNATEASAESAAAKSRRGRAVTAPSSAPALSDGGDDGSDDGDEDDGDDGADDGDDDSDDFASLLDGGDDAFADVTDQLDEVLGDFGRGGGGGSGGGGDADSELEPLSDVELSDAEGDDDFDAGDGEFDFDDGELDGEVDEDDAGGEGHAATATQSLSHSGGGAVAIAPSHDAASTTSSGSSGSSSPPVKKIPASQRLLGRNPFTGAGTAVAEAAVVVAGDASAVTEPSDGGVEPTTQIAPVSTAVAAAAGTFNDPTAGVAAEATASSLVLAGIGSPKITPLANARNPAPAGSLGGAALSGGSGGGRALRPALESPQSAVLPPAASAGASATFQPPALRRPPSQQQQQPLPYGLGALSSPPECHNVPLGVRFGVAEDQGKRSTMEDRCMAVIDMQQQQQQQQQAVVAAPPAPATAAASNGGGGASPQASSLAVSPPAIPPPLPPLAYFGVYDGHNGSECAQWLARRLHVHLARAEGFSSDPAAALVRAFLHSDRVFLRKQAEAERASREAVEAASRLPVSGGGGGGGTSGGGGDGRLAAALAAAEEFKFSGATAVSMLVREEVVPRADVEDDCEEEQEEEEEEAAVAADNGSGSASEGGSDGGRVVTAARLYIAHVGDCRAVLSHRGRAVDLTLDHKPSTRPDEVARIAAAGGWTHNGRLHGVLAVSRAFGDAEHKSLKERFWECDFKADPLIAEPDIRIHTVRRADEFVVLACDGVFDVMSSQMVVNFVRRKLRGHRDVQCAAEQLVAKAIALNSVDNVSAFVVAFHQQPAGGVRG